MLPVALVLSGVRKLHNGIDTTIANPAGKNGLLQIRNGITKLMAISRHLTSYYSANVTLTMEWSSNDSC